ncbi:MAG: GLPGLI family protein [Taibaiella sp.]|jgi:GLPGLI family protein
MKATLLIPALFLAIPLSAQQTSGIIIYDQVISIDIEGHDLPEGIAAMMPKEQKFEKVLYFSPEATLYENSDKGQDDQKQEFKQDNMQIHIERSIPDEKTYTDITNKRVVEQKDLMGRMFLVSRNIEPEKWKFTGRQKKILNLPCMEAISAGDKDITVAWYTPNIPVQAGPEHISGLPGMVLEANIGTMIHLLAKRIEPGNDVTKKIKEPAKGKKISAEGFAKLQKEKEEEMRKQYGGKGNVIIMKQAR